MTYLFRTLSLVASSLLCAIIGAGVAHATDNAPLVKHLQELSQKSNGICLLPTGGDLAFDIVNNSRFMVVSQEPTAERATSMRARADRAGLLGRRFYVVDADANMSVLANNYANLLVITDASDDLLLKLDQQVMLKVLTPHGGKAIVGLAKGAPGKLSQGKLTTWVNGFHVPEARVIADDFGLWAIVTKPQLSGAAEWTHRFFDSGFNPLSTDTAFGLPSMTQWLDTPYNHGAGSPRIAGGKLLSVMEGAYSDGRPQREVNYLIMRDAYNGSVLWKRDLGVEYAADYYLSSVVMTADAVYVVDMPNPIVLVLKPDTGVELRRIDCSALGKQVKWIALRDGILFAAGGNTDHTGGPWNGVMGAQHVKFIRDNNQALQDSIAIGNNRTLGAFDLTTGKAQWTHDEQQDCIPECLIAVRNGQLYFLAQQKYVGVLDVKTGALAWTNPDAAKIYQDNLYPQFAVGSGALEVSDDTLLFARPGSARIALNAADGKLLWSSSKYGGHQQCGSLIWDKYVLGQTSVDLRTGVVKWGPGGAGTGNPYRNICTFGAASVKYITGMAGPAFDLQTMTPVPRPTIFHKAPCSIGSIVGEGVIFLSSFHCECSYQLNGNIVEMSGDARQYQQPAVETERLKRTTAPDPLAPLAADGSDWPVFRATNSRGNGSSAEVPAKVAPRWTFALDKPYINPEYPSDRSETSYEAAQPLAVGNLVITSGPDGVVRAFDLESGKSVWTYYTGGQITQSPAIAEGRAYVPSGDGYLYCLDAASGVELWRFRAAPAERRMMVYGHLVSSWPLFAGVLVQDGVVYTAASLLNMDATQVYALDAKNGHIVWQNNSSGLPYEKSEDGATAVGTMTIAQGRLWIRATSYDLKTGTCQMYADARRPNLAKDGNPGSMDGGNGILNRNTGVIDGKFLLFGGRRFYESQSRPLEIGRPTPLSLVELNADGTGIFPRIDLVSPTGAFAAWDTRQLITAPAMADYTSINGAIKHSPVLCWDLAKTIAMAQDDRATLAKIHDYSSMLKWNAKVAGKTSWEKIADLPMHEWMLDTDGAYAVALAKNVVLTAYGMMDTDARAKLNHSANVVPSKWYVSALDRATGKEIWQQPLPSEPVYDGLCIARDGSVIVQLLDGGVICVGAQIAPGSEHN